MVLEAQEGCRRNLPRSARSQGHGEESAIYQNYKAVFLNSDSDILQGSCIMDYCRLFPEGDQKQGRRRGSAAEVLTKHAMVYKQAKEISENDEMLEYEVFVCKMSQIRRWTDSQSHAEWKLLESNKLTEKDNLGYRGAQRLRVPSALVAGGNIKNYQEEAEEKRLEFHKKPKLANEEEAHQEMGDLSKGFQGFVGGMEHDSSQPLPSSARSAIPIFSVATDIENLSDLLKKHLPAEQKDAAETEGNNNDNAGSSSTGSGMLQPSPTKPGKVRDLATLRSTQFTSIYRDFNKVCASMEELSTTSIQQISESKVSQDAECSLIQSKRCVQFILLRIIAKVCACVSQCCLQALALQLFVRANVSCCVVRYCCVQPRTNNDNNNANNNCNNKQQHQRRHHHHHQQQQQQTQQQQEHQQQQHTPATPLASRTDIEWGTHRKHGSVRVSNANQESS